MKNEEAFRAFCEKRGVTHRLRRIQETEVLSEGRALFNGQKLVNFASNDYLGLSHHPLVIKRAQEFAASHGTGSTSSRLLSGTFPVYAKVEERLARGLGKEAALVMNCGYQANVTTLAALLDSEVVGKPVVVLADRLCHNSLLQGILLSGARLMRFQHKDYDQLAKLLRQQVGKDVHLAIVSDSVFSMDGDRADLPILIKFAREYGAMLYIDEAHSVGLFGPDGFGLCAEHKGEVDVVMGSFGKAFGGFGAYVACNGTLRDYLIQRCAGFIYSTALPPPVLGAADAVLELLPQMQNARDHLQRQVMRLRDALQKQGWNCGESTTQIMPVIIGEEQATLDLANALRENGILTLAVRPPTVPREMSRLRLSLSAAHSAEDINRLIAVMATQAERHARPVAQAS
jgi:8-amino-7-oxononanoate synthase